MKTLFFTLAILIIYNCSDAQIQENIEFTQKPEYDSIKRWTMAIDSVYYLDLKYGYDYDVNNDLVHFIEYNWEINKWQGKEENNYTYDANHNCIRDYARFTGLDNQWYDNFLITRTYDQYSHETSYSKIISEGLPWRNDNRIFNTWENGNLVQVLEQEGNELQWFDKKKSENIYDENNNLITSLGSYLIGSEWTPSERYTFSYNDHFSLVRIIIELYNSNGWRNFTMHTYSFDANDKFLADSIFTWQNNSWGAGRQLKRNIYNTLGNPVIQYINYDKYTNTFNENNKIISRLKEMCISQDTVKIDSLRIEYDSKERPFYSKLYTISNGNWVFERDSLIEYYSNDWIKTLREGHRNGNDILYDSTIYYIHTPLGFHEKIDFDNIVIYPNPGNGSFVVSSNYKIQLITIYDLAGKMIYQLPGDNSSKIYIDFPVPNKGLYLLKIVAENRLVATKLVIN